MNDFTKEELIKILKAYEMDPYYFDSYVKLDNFGGRIKAMIDNYPEPIPEFFIDYLKYKTATRDLSELVNIDEFNKTMDAYKDE